MTKGRILLVEDDSALAELLVYNLERENFEVQHTADGEEAMLLAQRTVPRVPPRLLHRSIRAMQAKRFVDWSFGHYLNIAPPSFAGAAPSSVVVDDLDVVAVGV